MYEHKQANPKLTHQELANWAKNKFELSKVPSKAKISKSVKRTLIDGLGNYSEDPKRKRQVPAKYPVIYTT